MISVLFVRGPQPVGFVQCFSNDSLCSVGDSQSSGSVYSNMEL